MNIADLIKQMSNDPTAETFTVVGTVKSVDENKRVCDVEFVNGNAEMFDCRLQSEIESDKGVVIIPKKDSFVLVTYISKNHGFISAFSEIEKIVIDVPEVSGTVDKVKLKTKIELNDGNNGGVVKVKELTDKINRLENQINNILAVLKSVSVALAPSGSFPFAPLFASINAIAPITQKSDFENTDIKH